MPLYRGGGCLGGSGGSFEEEGEAVEGVDGFAVGRGLYLALAGADGLNGVYKFGEDGMLCAPRTSLSWGSSAAIFLTEAT